MPILRPYTQQTPAPQGQIDVQSSSQDFGQQVGQGIQQAGQGMESLNDSERAVVEQKGQIWAIKAASDMRLQQMNAMEQMQQDPAFAKKYGEDGSGFVAAYRQQFEDSANAALDAAPTGQARRFLNSQLTELGGSMSDQAMKFQSVTGAQWATNSLTQTINQNQSATYMNPSQRQSILDSTNASIDAMPHLDQTQRDALKLTAKKMSAFAAGRKDAVDNNKDILGLVDPTLAAKLNPTANAMQTIGSMRVQVPQPMGGDTVKPFDGAKVAQVIQQATAPNQYDYMYQQAAKQYGGDWQDQKMRNVVESGLDPKATGPMTASGQSVGLAQFTEATAAKYGVIDRTDPQQSIFGQARLLADLRAKAGGDASKVDKMYYGGESGANWGANTNQYAENLNAVRATLSGGDSVHTSFDQVLASVTQDKAPLKFDNAGSRYSYLNDLTFEEQYSIMREAKQNQLQDLQRQEQIDAHAERARTLAQKQEMMKWPTMALNGTLTDSYISDLAAKGVVDFEGQKQGMELIHADLKGEMKDNPHIAASTFEGVVDGSVNDPKQVYGLVGHGLSIDTADKIVKQMEGSETPEGKMVAEQKKAFYAAAKTGFGVLDQFGNFNNPTAAFHYANFLRDSSAMEDAGVKAGVSRKEFYDQNSKHYLGQLLSFLPKTDSEKMQAAVDAAKAMTPKGAPAPIVVSPTPPADIPLVDDAATYALVPSGKPYKTKDGMTRVKP